MTRWNKKRPVGGIAQEDVRNEEIYTQNSQMASWSDRKIQEKDRNNVSGKKLIPMYKKKNVATKMGE